MIKAPEELLNIFNELHTIVRVKQNQTPRLFRDLIIYKKYLKISLSTLNPSFREIYVYLIEIAKQTCLEVFLKFVVHFCRKGLTASDFC